MDMYYITGYKSEYGIITGDSHFCMPRGGTPIEAENKARNGGLKYITETKLWIKGE